MKLNELVSFTKLGKTDEKPDTGNAGPDNAPEEKEEEHIDRGTKIKIIAALVVVGFAVYVAWWVQEPGSVRAAEDMGGTTETAETSEKTAEVSFVDFALDPAELTVEKGTTVVWTNKDTVPHTVTGPIFTSGTMDRGQSYSFTFRDEGTFEYHCSYHPQIAGKIIVGTGGDTQAITEEMMALGGTEDLLPPLEDLSPAAGEEMPSETIPTEEVILPENLSAEPLQETGLSESVLKELMADNAPAETAAADLGEAGMHEAAVKSDKLASSGPEDFLYVGAFLLILFLNRRKLFPAKI